MRIIGGRLRGVSLAGLRGGDAQAHLRPTGDRVRESIFNLLAHGGYGDPPPPMGCRVLDLFAGTGALGLEALSRGAETACFVESGKKALSILRSNIKRLDLAAVTQVLVRDATRIGDNPTSGYDMAFLDPPYRTDLGERALQAAHAGGWLKEGALVLWEHDGSASPLPNWGVLDERRYGETTLSILRAPAQ